MFSAGTLHCSHQVVAPLLAKTGETYKVRLIDHRIRMNVYGAIGTVHVATRVNAGTWFNYFGYRATGLDQSRFSIACQLRRILPRRLRITCRIRRTSVFGVLTTGFNLSVVQIGRIDL